MPTVSKARKNQLLVSLSEEEINELDFCMLEMQMRGRQQWIRFIILATARRIRESRSSQ